MSFLISIIMLISIIIMDMGETAIIGLTKQSIVSYYNNGEFARKVTVMKDNLESIIVTVLICDSILYFMFNNIVITMLNKKFPYNPGIAHLLGTIITVVLTIFNIFSKILAIKYPNQIMFVSYWFLKIGSFITKPLLLIIQPIINKINQKNSTVYHSTKELISYLDLQKNTDNHEEVEMMKSLLFLKDTTINNIITYKSSFIDAEFNDNLEQMKRSVLHASHKKKIIIWQGNKDNILGTIDTKEFLTQFVQNNITNIKYLIKEPKFFSDSADLYSLLQYFRVTNNKIVFVINEYGILLGIATLTDIINEIIGETDCQDEDFFEKIDDSKALVDGMYYLRTLNKKMGWDIPEEPLTVLGLLMSVMHSVPQESTQIEIGNYLFSISSVNGNKIDRVLVCYTNGNDYCYNEE